MRTERLKGGLRSHKALPVLAASKAASRCLWAPNLHSMPAALQQVLHCHCVDLSICSCWQVCFHAEAPQPRIYMSWHVFAKATCKYTASTR